MGAGRTRFWVGPWPAKQAEITRSSSSRRRFWFLSATCTAFAMAERRAFSMSRATDFLVNRRIERASAAFLPRIRSRTRPAFWAEVRMYFATAFTSSMALSLGLRGARRGGARPGAGGSARRRKLGHLLDLGRVPLELAGGGELAQLVPHHVLGDVDGNELPAVVDGQGVPDHLRGDGGAPRPGLHHLAVVGRVHLLDLLEQVIVHPRALLERSCHVYLRLLMMKPRV